MDQAFTAILQQLIAEQGKEALLNPAKCKSLLADYTRNEYKKESRLLLQAIEAETIKAIDSAQDLDLCKQQQVKILREEYFLAEDIAKNLVDTLILVLWGHASKTEPPDNAENNNPNIPQKRMYYVSYNNQSSGPYEKSAIEAMITNGQITAEYYIHSSLWQPITSLFTFPAVEEPKTNDFDGGFVRVEGGTFQMGSNNGSKDEKPVHSVTVKSFCIGKYEVTQKEWVEVMGHNPSHFQGDNLPVECVSWDDAVEYCNKRSQKEGLSPVYGTYFGNIVGTFSADGYRLPTEAEWEFAAMGGYNGLMKYTYSGSNDAGAVAWYKDNSGGSTHDVGTKAPNSLGLYDMTGNVWEWCGDWYGSYSDNAQTDPTGASSGPFRVLRGGSWDGLVQNCRSVYRGNSTSYTRFNNIGLRLVRKAE